MRKHKLSHSVFRRWRENFNERGISNLKSYASQRNPEVDALEEQIRVLKNIVAKQHVELEFKTELLKKKSIPRAVSVEVMQQFKSNLMVTKQGFLNCSSVPRSSFYYKRGVGIRGRKATKMTITRDGELVDNAVVLQNVETILQRSFAAMDTRTFAMSSRKKVTSLSIRRFTG